MTELRAKMIRAMELKNLSHHTQRESRSLKITLLSLILGLGIAWLTSFVFYQAALVLGFHYIIPMMIDYFGWAFTFLLMINTLAYRNR